MLKIKDNIDLKELEKLGFNFEKEHGLFSNRYIYEYNEQTIEVNADDRTILAEDVSGSYSFGAIVDSVLTKLYELIKSDLVEKVED